MRFPKDPQNLEKAFNLIREIYWDAVDAAEKRLIDKLKLEAIGDADASHSSSGEGNLPETSDSSAANTQ